MKIKQLTAMLLSGVLAISFCACNNTKKPEGESSIGEVVSEESSTDSTESESSEESSKSSEESSKSETNSQTSNSKVNVNVNKKLKPISASDDNVLLKNPDRGFRLEVWFDTEYMSTNRSYDAIKAEAIKLLDSKLLEAAPESIKLAQSYIKLGAYNERAITEKGLVAIQAYLDALKEKGLKALLRFVYSEGQNDREHDAKQEIMLQHMQQLRPLMAKNKDVIHVYQAGFIGAWGEWHSEVYPIDKAVIIKNIMEVLVPNDTFVQIRLPKYKNGLPSNHDGYKRIGFHNDSFFGKIVMPVMESGGFDPNTKQWEQAIKQSPYSPQDGELYWSDWSIANNKYCDGLDAILHLSEHRFTSLSVLHGYKDNEFEPTTAMGKWKKAEVTEQWLKDNKITYSPNWFKNEKGETVKRNPFEFVRDYLGYRLEAQGVKISGDNKAGASIDVQMPLINYGCSAAFNMKSGFAILDENNKVISTVGAGDPAKWYSRSPSNYADNKLLTHNVTANMKLPSKSGHYKIAFFLKNNLDDFARLGNQVNFVNGYNVLHEFDI